MKIAANNNMSFKAKIVSSVNMPNTKRFEKICGMFENFTKSYPNDALYISQPEQGVAVLSTSSIKVDKFLFGDAIFTRPMRALFDSNSDLELAKMFFESYMMLKLYKSYHLIESELRTLSGKMHRNIQIADSLRQSGQEDFAKRYDVFAGFNCKHINALKNQMKNIKKLFNEKKEKLAVSLPEVYDLVLK